MRIFLPFNSKYFMGHYSNQGLVDKIESEVIPDIIERHSLNENVKNIDIYSNLDFSEMEFLSNKVCFIQNESYEGENFVDLVQGYINKSSENEEVLVYHNPLFPFISLKKAFAAFEFVKSNPNCILNAELGILSDSSTHHNIDLGAVSVFNFRTLKRLGNRNSGCSERIELTALEMLCLRYSDDLEHYNLIINSGFKV